MTRLLAVFVTLFLVCSSPITILAHNESSNVLKKDEDKKKNKDKQPTTPAETRVYIKPKCVLSAPTEEFFPALAAIVIPHLIKGVLSGVGSAIKKAGDPQELRDTGRLPTYLYEVKNNLPVKEKDKDEKKRGTTLNPNLGCVIIVRGTFTQADPSPGQTLTTTGVEESPVVKALITSGQIPVKTIDLAFEAKVIKSKDSSAIRYEAGYLAVNAFQGKRSSNTRNLVITIAVNGAGPKDGEPTLNLGVLNVGEVSLGTVKYRDQLANVRTGWLGGIGMTDEAVASLEDIPQDREQEVMPVTFEGTVVETDDGSKALRFIAALLDASKDELTTAISSEITKDRDKAKEEKSDAVEKLRLEEEEAYSNYLEALKELADAKDASAEEKAIKKFKVDQSCRVWTRKYNALKTIGATIPGRVPACTP